MREALLSLLAWAVMATAFAQPAPAPGDTGDLALAVKKLRLSPNFKAELYASEPLIQNPVSFAFDAQGAAFVVETHRRRTSVFDIRNHPDWLDDDFSFRSVADRSNFFRTVLVPGNTNLPAKIIVDRNGDGVFDYQDLEVESERVRKVWDTDGDQKADRATTFAEGFNSLVSGVAAGVLPRQGDVYFTCIPDLWRLRDGDGDGVAEVRQPLATGFGVHISFGGHDLHGLKFGPDGRLYFSVADRGLNVVSGTNTLFSPDTGAILRCDPDGSNLEIFATGFRNPQELAFDQFGNLWTGDNNGDAGDKARWLYVVEGGDYGWHYGWQHLPNLGPWNNEALWEMAPTNTSAQVLPPVAHIGHGPAGLAFYPGTGLPLQFRHHFFLCDFPGGVNTFAVQGKGAGFAVVNQRQFLWELFPVDVDFGPDGGVYVLDWVEGWDKTGRGRLFRIFEERSAQDAAVAQTRRLLAEGMALRPPEELGQLLNHVDLRVRQEAQFELAARGPAMTNLLARIALDPAGDIGRVHAIWALGQIGRVQPLALLNLFPLFEDAGNAEIRAQAAKVLGDSRFPLGLPYLARAAADPIPRVRYFGILGLGKLRLLDGVELILQNLRQNDDRDPFLRHASVMALHYLNDASAFEAAAKDASPAVRLGALLAMRRTERPEVALFLYESKPQLVVEAARAIYDTPIPSGLSQLAALIANPGLPKAAMRRALHANYRLGKLENAMALAEFAANTQFIPELRVDAIQLLAQWGAAPKRDLFLGLWRPLPERQARAASVAFRSGLPRLLPDGPAEVRLAAIQAAVSLEMSAAGAELQKIFANPAEAPSLRLAALRALAALRDPQLNTALKLAIADADPAVRTFAATVQAKRQPKDTVSLLLRMLDTGIVPEKQSALEMLGPMENPAIDSVLLMWLDRVVTGKAPRELELEILEASAKRSHPLIQAQWKKFQESRASDPVAAHAEALAGGDADLGRKIFFERQDVQCLRCHKLNGTGGELGPDLTGLGGRLSRVELLESILLPSKKFSPGFENLTIKMMGGETHIGLLKKEDAENLYVDSPDDGPLRVPKAEIENLEFGLSTMPADVATLLSKRDLRNLIEFLARQTGPPR